jgi:hypothetical protein
MHVTRTVTKPQRPPYCYVLRQGKGRNAGVHPAETPIRLPVIGTNIRLGGVSPSPMTRRVAAGVLPRPPIIEAGGAHTHRLSLSQKKSGSTCARAASLRCVLPAQPPHCTSTFTLHPRMSMMVAPVLGGVSSDASTKEDTMVGAKAIASLRITPRISHPEPQSLSGSPNVSGSFFSVPKRGLKGIGQGSC